MRSIFFLPKNSQKKRCLEPQSLKVSTSNISLGTPVTVHTLACTNSRCAIGTSVTLITGTSKPVVVLSSIGGCQ